MDGDRGGASVSRRFIYKEYLENMPAFLADLCEKNSFFLLDRG